MKLIRPETKLALLLDLRFSGQHLAFGTGFVVISPSGPMLLTNRHNVRGRDNRTDECLSAQGGVPDEIAITHHARSGLGQWVSRVEPLYVDDGKPRWIEHPVLKGRADFVALPLTQLDGVELFPVDLTEGARVLQVDPAEPVSVIGYPFGRSTEGGFPIWATGFLATELVLDFDELPCTLIDCRSRQGQSGSPVVAYRPPGSGASYGDGTAYFGEGRVSRFLGIYSGRINKESDLGIVWKVHALRELVGIIGTQKRFTSFGTSNVLAAPSAVTHSLVSVGGLHAPRRDS